MHTCCTLIYHDNWTCEEGIRPFLHASCWKWRKPPHVLVIGSLFQNDKKINILFFLYTAPYRPLQFHKCKMMGLNYIDYWGQCTHESVRGFLQEAWSSLMIIMTRLLYLLGTTLVMNLFASTYHFFQIPHNSVLKWSVSVPLGSSAAVVALYNQ